MSHDDTHLHGLLDAGEQPRLPNWEWGRAFVEQMQMRGTSRRRAGDALAEAESHCAESGERLEQAFGNPADYAEELAGPPRVLRGFWRIMGPLLLGMAALLLLLGLPVTSPGTSLALGWAAPARALAFAVFAVVVLLVRLRARGSQGLQAAGFVVAMMTLEVVQQHLRGWHRTMVMAPAWTLWLLTLAVTLAAIVVVTRALRDRAADPRGSSDGWPPTWWGTVRLWLFPAACLLVLALRLLFSHG